MTSVESPSALTGVKVLDLTHHIAGPYCTKLFADAGADVVKVERPDGGDPARGIGPFLHDEPGLDRSGLFLHLNTNKRSITVNLRSEAGRKIVLDLARASDILVENFAPDFLPSVGLTYAAFQGVNPRLVMTSLSNFGQTGPYRDYKMSEITAYALGGTMQNTGLADREPLKLGLTVEQFFAGMISATATMGAHLESLSSGSGQHVDLAIMEIMAGNQDRAVQGHMMYRYTGPSGVGRAGGPGAGRNIMPTGVYPTVDGYVQFFTLQPHWDRICRMIEREDLINDPYFTAPEHFTGNPEVKAEFDAILLEWLLTHTKREVMERSQECGYPCGAINTMEDVFDDPHLAARGFFTQVDHPATGVLTYPGAPYKMSETPWRAGRAPMLGEHTFSILRDQLGYGAEDIARLKEQGAI